MLQLALDLSLLGTRRYTRGATTYVMGSYLRVLVATRWGYVQLCTYCMRKT